MGSIRPALTTGRFRNAHQLHRAMLDQCCSLVRSGHGLHPCADGQEGPWLYWPTWSVERAGQGSGRSSPPWDWGKPGGRVLLLGQRWAGREARGVNMVLLPNESASAAVSAPCASSEFGRIGQLFGVPHIEADARWSCFVLACVMEHHLLKEMEECDFQW